jgi:hypothetical protein
MDFTSAKTQRDTASLFRNSRDHCEQPDRNKDLYEELLSDMHGVGMDCRAENDDLLTVLKERIAKRLAIIVLKPGARQDCAMKPSFSSARHITSSPCFQSHDGMFSK